MTGTRTEKKRKSDPPAAPQQGDPALNLEMLRSMLLQRRFEERTAEAYALGKIGGFCHLYIGQEACGTGAISTLRDDDYVITTYRDHGRAVRQGGRLRAREGRLDAPVRRRRQLPRRPRHRRRSHPDRDRRRLR